MNVKYINKIKLNVCLCPKKVFIFMNYTKSNMLLLGFFFLNVIACPSWPAHFGQILNKQDSSCRISGSCLALSCQTSSSCDRNADKPDFSCQISNRANASHSPHSFVNVWNLNFYSDHLNECSITRRSLHCLVRPWSQSMRASIRPPRSSAAAPNTLAATLLVFRHSCFQLEPKKFEKFFFLKNIISKKYLGYQAPCPHCHIL